MSLKTQGTELYILDPTNSGSEVQKIANVTGGSGVGGEAGTIDTTNLSSTAMEFVAGLKDNGTVSFDVNWDPSEASHVDLDALVGGDNVRLLIAGSESTTQPSYSSSYTLPTDRTTIDFTGAVLSFQKDFSTDDIWRGSVSVRVSGAITITPAA